MIQDTYDVTTLDVIKVIDRADNPFANLFERLIT